MLLMQYCNPSSSSKRTWVPTVLYWIFSNKARSVPMSVWMTNLGLQSQYFFAFPNLGPCSRIYAICKLISTARSKLGKKLQCGGTRFPIISLNRNSEYLAVPPSLQHDRRTTTGQPAFRAKYENQYPNPPRKIHRRTNLYHTGFYINKTRKTRLKKAGTILEISQIKCFFKIGLEGKKKSLFQRGEKSEDFESLESRPKKAI